MSQMAINSSNSQHKMVLGESRGFSLPSVILYSRSLGEYRDMFNLTGKDLKRSILGVADGVSSFNMQMDKKGRPMTSVDPVYALNSKDITALFRSNLDDIFSQITRESTSWQWHYYEDAKAMRKHCEKAFQRFIEHYPNAKKKQYVNAQLPDLPFKDDSYELVLSAHLLFLYEHLFDLRFHWLSLMEMLRVGKEVRVFPLVNIQGECSSHLDPIMARLLRHGFKVDLVPVPYCIRGDVPQRMLRIRRGESSQRYAGCEMQHNGIG